MVRKLSIIQQYTDDRKSQLIRFTKTEGHLLSRNQYLMKRAYEQNLIPNKGWSPFKAGRNRKESGSIKTNLMYDTGVPHEKSSKVCQIWTYEQILYYQQKSNPCLSSHTLCRLELIQGSSCINNLIIARRQQGFTGIKAEWKKCMLSFLFLVFAS